MNEEEQKVELKNRLLGIGTEVGGGIGTDFLTAGLLNPLTLAKTGGLSALAYGAINFGQGAYTNYLVQKYVYGEDKINWGEVIASGGMGAIPFMNIGASKGAAKIVGRANSFQRGVVGGGLTSLAGEQTRVGIDEQRFLNPIEAVTAVGFGGAVGGAFKTPQALKNRQLANRLRRPSLIGPDGKLDLKAIEAARAKIQPETLALSAELKKKTYTDAELAAKPNWDGSMPTDTGAGPRLEAAIKRLRAAGYIRRDGSLRPEPKVTPSKTTRLVKSFQTNPESDIRTWRQGSNKLVQDMDAKLTARELSLIHI